MYTPYHIARPRRSALALAATGTLVVATCTLVVATGTLVACNPHDTLFATPHPDHAQVVTLTADWSACTTGQPDRYTVSIGDFTASFTRADATLTHLFAPGRYAIRVYNHPEGITVDESGATVTAAPSTRASALPLITPLPGWLYTNTTDTLLVKDTDYYFTVLMRQQVRQLTLRITPAGDAVDRIAAIEGTLEGVAGTFDFAADRYGAPAAVPLSFVRQADGNWTTTFRLLGIVPTAGQRLQGTVRFVDDHPAALSFESDLSPDMTPFNADKRTPMLLSGTLVQTYTAAGVTGSIGAWEEVTSGESNAD
jgi:hypothetical protein